MKRMEAFRHGITALLMAGGALASWAEELSILSFDETGRLVFNVLEGATNYEVNTASEVSHGWSVAKTVEPTGGSALTTTVSVAGSVGFYKIVARLSEPPVPEGMVRIPGGTNTGTDPDDGLYSLTVDSFSMDTNEVTKAKWDEVYAWAVSNGYGFDNAGSGKAENHPVHGVNWFDSVKWCNARSQREGRTPVYYTDVELTQVYRTGQYSEPYVNDSADGYRLPTDVQWEYAARGGLSGRRFPWEETDTIQHARANYNSSSSYSYDTSPTRGHHPTYATGDTPYTAPVGSFAPNGYGLHDMAGNVKEWCYDWHPDYVDWFRVQRGGGWSGYADSCRVADRYADSPGVTGNHCGFRTVLK